MADSQAYIRAKSFRRRMTPPEACLWRCFRASRFQGFKIRRQHPIGPFILDFYCAARNLAIEVDGMGHYEQAQADHDARRAAWLQTQGVRIVRVAAVDVRDNLEGVLDWLQRELRSCDPPPEPPPPGR